MMRLKKNTKVVHMILLAMAAVAFVGITASSAATFEPGTAEDPVVSQSYVDTKINELNVKIADQGTKLNDQSSQIQSLKNQIQSGGQVGVPQGGAKYIVVGPLAPGKQIIAGESTEIVLRAGTATAIGALDGGVADLISGADLKSGDVVMKNHLLLVPKDDGRGISITGIPGSQAWVLIRGSYTIK